MQRIVYALITALCASDAYAAAQSDSKHQIYFHNHVFGYSETAPIEQIIDDFEGPYFDGGEHSFTHNIWEVGVTHSGWKMAYLIRYDYALNYTEDTAELIYGDKNDLPIEKNRVYNVDLNLVHTRVKGLKLGYQWQLTEQFRLGIDASYLETSDLLEGEINGQFTADEDSYTGRLDLDYVYSTDKLLERVVDEPKGRGYALDLAWDWQLGQRIRLKGKWTDLLSEVTFDKAPYTSATAMTDRIDFDDEGKIDVKPVLSGVEGYRKHRLQFPRQMHLEARYQLFHNQRQTGFDLTTGWYQYDQLNFYALGAIYKLSDRVDVVTRFDFKSDALTLGLGTSNLNLAVTSDRLQFNKARTLGLDVSAYLAF